ncbi:MAG: phosphatidylserine decarboxylase family protein [Balneolaceae bacterium]|nr:phosphatidylserine decarboxylase family protein [Balneolaceae bacterium]
MFARDGYSTIALAFFFWVVGSAICIFYINHWVSWPIVISLTILFGLLLYFFRDPDRNIPDDPNALLSPADGKVVLIKEVEENVYLKDKAIQISIFLSPLDVHVNRVPASGNIEYVKYHPGVYLMAWDERSSTMNERADFGLLHDSGVKILFRQITGFLARRIVYRLEEGDKVSAGERFGMMKFGSRMDILVPTGMNLNIEEGNRTIAGETVLGSFTADGKKK